MRNIGESFLVSLDFEFTSSYKHIDLLEWFLLLTGNLIISY